jgi:hypothetical protein
MVKDKIVNEIKTRPETRPLGTRGFHGLPSKILFLLEKLIGLIQFRKGESRHPIPHESQCSH